MGDLRPKFGPNERHGIPRSRRACEKHSEVCSLMETTTVVQHEERTHYDRVYHRSLYPSSQSGGPGSQVTTDQLLWTNPAVGPYCPENREVQSRGQAL